MFGTAHIPVALKMHNAEVNTPSAVAILMVTVLTWGAAWGVQLMWASSIIPGSKAEPSGYWFVYSTVAAAFAVWMYYLYNLLKTKVHSLLLRRTRRAQLSGSEVAEQYLLRREIRDRNRPVKGFGGPVPARWTEFLNSPQ
ncbi:MAG: hypothetical protein K8I27_16025 [Planctomycetes bacterium]|nr:hypothetical protein [Planctomycetota bacterium]